MRCGPVAHATCHFLHAPFNYTQAQGLNETLLSACPSVATLKRAAPDASAPASLAVALLRLLRGHKVAILGDSMSRQMWSTLVGLLRDQEHFLDPSTWHPARYVVRGVPAAEQHDAVAGGGAAAERSGGGPHACLHDFLDLYWQPDERVANAEAATRPHWSAVHAARADAEAASVSASIAPGRRSSADSTSRQSRSSLADSIVADWILLPRFEPEWAVANGLQLLRASHATRAYSAVLIFVPAAWHTRDRDDKRQFYELSNYRVPPTFWAALTNLTRELSPAGTRFAAVTMPLEEIGCSRSDLKSSGLIDAARLRADTRMSAVLANTNANHGDASAAADGSIRGADERPSTTASINPSTVGNLSMHTNTSVGLPHGLPNLCRAHRCCRRAIVAARNAFVGLPDGWIRLDFAALTAASGGVESTGGWHYECQLTPPHGHGESGVRACAEDAMRLKFNACNQRYAAWYAGRRTPPIQTRALSHDCREAGNTLLWRHVAESGVGSRLFPPAAQ